MMIEKEIVIKLVSRMLVLLSDEFSNHGCNDFDLVRDGQLNSLEAQKVKQTLQQDGFKDDVCQHDIVMDWMIMNWLIEKLKEF